VSLGSVQVRKGKRGLSFRAVYPLPPGPDGRRRQATATFKTKKAAHAWLAEKHGRIVQGVRDDGERMRLSVFLTDHWLPFYASQRKVASYVIREGCCRNHIVPTLGRLTLGTLSPAIIQTFYTDLSRRYAPNTVLTIATTLSAALRMAVSWELLHRNPAQGARTAPITRREPSVWTPAQVRAFLAAEPDPDWHCLWAVLIETGMRRGEVLALRWDDVDFDAGTLRVERTITRAGKGQGLTIGPTKTARGTRNVALSGACLALLQGIRRPPAFRGGLPAKLADRIFPVTVDQFYSRFLRISASVPGLPRIRPHDARHSNVVAALEAGIPLIVISERLGHASIQITASTYAHVTRRLDRESAETIGGLLLGEQGVDGEHVLMDEVEVIEDAV
jgi:integrase